MVQSIKVKRATSRCRQCGKCCEFIYFKIIHKDEKLTLESVNNQKDFFCHNPYTDKERKDDFLNWVKYHSLIKTITYMPIGDIFCINIQEQKITQLKKMKQKNCWLIKVDCRCDKLKDNKCLIYPNHPIVCQEEIGYPLVKGCLVRLR